MFSWLSGSARRQGEGASFGQSPSAPPDVRGRLNFSSLGTPRPPPASRVSSAEGVASPQRLGEYHRSKQSPAVLDQFISSRSPQALYKSSPSIRSTSERFNLFSSPHGTTGFPPLSRRAQTPFRLSPFQSGNTSPFGTGLVSMAVRGRLRQGSGVSPVMVHLPGSSNSSLTGCTEPDGGDGAHSGGEAQLDPCNKDVVVSALKQKRKRWACQTGDDVVANVDSQPAAKRSRHSTEPHRSSSLSPTSLFARPSLHSRKRDHTSSGGTLTSSLSQSLKKPRVFRPPVLSPWKQSAMTSLTVQQESMNQAECEEEGKKMDTEVVRVRDHVTMPETGQAREQPASSRAGSGSGTGTGRSLKLSIPESEYESDSESVRGAIGGGGGGVKGDGVEESSVDSGRGSRGSTPPVQEEEEEESKEDERTRRNRAELQRLQKSLTTVFPSLHKSSSRRRLPVFCATGSAPLQPPSLTSTRGVSQEDWRREREMARARLRSFLASDDDPPTKPHSPPPPAEKQSPVATPVTTTSSSLAPPTTTAALSLSQPPAASLNQPPAGVATSSSAAGVKVPKSVTFQLPNVATSTQSLSSLSTFSQNSSVQLPDASPGTGGLKLGSELVAQNSSPAPPLSLPPPAPPSSSNQTPPPSLISYASQPLQVQQQKQQQQQEESKQQQQQQQCLKPAAQSLPLPLPPLKPGGLLQTTPIATPTNTLVPPVQPATTAASDVAPSLPSLTQPIQQPSSHLAQPTTLAVNMPPSLSFPHSQPQQLPSLCPAPQVSQPAQSTFPVSLPAPSISGSSLTFPGLSTGFGNSLASYVGSMAGGLKFGPSGGLGLTTTSAQTGTRSGNGTQTTFSGQTPVLQLQQVPSSAPLQQNLAPGGLFQPPLNSPSVGPTFNFGGGTGSFKFSSGASAPQQKPALIFGGAAPQNQNPSGGLGFGGPSGGGVFGATSTVTTTMASLATPTFNFSATSSSNPGTQQKLSGGIFGGNPGSSLQPTALLSNPPTFNFGAKASQTQQSSVATVNSGNLFNFSASLQKQPSSSGGVGGLLFGGGGGGASNSVAGVTGFNFSAAVSQAGPALGGVAGSGMGLGFGTAPAASGGTGGFNFAAAASTPAGGLNFGGAPGGGAFGGGSTNQIQPGGMFGQTTPQNKSSAASVFNPSLTTPSNPTAQPPQLGGFNFTPQPSSGGFNFGAVGGTPGGINFGSPGVGGGALFSAGTPKAGDSSRPVATARRRRGRRK